MSISSDTWRRLFLPTQFQPSFHARDCLDRLRQDFDRLVAAGHTRSWTSDESSELSAKLTALQRWGTEDDILRLLPLCVHSDSELQTLVVKCILKMSSEAFPSQLLPIIELSWPEASHYALLQHIARMFDARCSKFTAEPHPEHRRWKPLLAPYLASMLEYPELSRRIQALMLLGYTEQADMLPRVAPLLDDWTTLRGEDWDELIELWRMEEIPSNDYILTVHEIALEAMCYLDLERCLCEGWIRWNSLAPLDTKRILDIASFMQPALSPDLFEPLLDHPQACIRLKALMLQERGLEAHGQALPESIWLEYLEPERRPDLYHCSVPYPVGPCERDLRGARADRIRQGREERLLDGSGYQSRLKTDVSAQCSGSQKTFYALLLEHFKTRQVQRPFSFAFCRELLSCPSMPLQAYGLELLAAQGWPETPALAQSWLQPEAKGQRDVAQRALCLYEAQLSGQVLSESHIAWRRLEGKDEALKVLLEQNSATAFLKLAYRYSHQMRYGGMKFSEGWFDAMMEWLVERGGPEVLSRMCTTLLALFDGSKAWQSEYVPRHIVHPNGGISSNPDYEDIFEIAEIFLQACPDVVDKELLRHCWRSGLKHKAAVPASNVRPRKNYLLWCMVRMASREDADDMIPELLGPQERCFTGLKIYLTRILEPQDMPALMALLEPANELLLPLAEVALEVSPLQAREHISQLLADYNFPGYKYSALYGLLAPPSSDNEGDD